jgi:hypothetical protein
MEGTLAARADRFVGSTARLWVCVVIAVAAWKVLGAGNACHAVSPAADSTMANPREPSAEGLLLTADRRFTSAARDQSARGFRSTLGAPSSDSPMVGPIKAPGGTRLLETIALDDNSLHVYLPADDFAETGPGAVKFAVAGLDVDTQRSVAGGLVHLITAANGRSRAMAEARMSWLFEYLQTEAVATAFFAPGDKGIFAVQGLSYGSNWLLLGGGLRWELSDRWSAHAGYDAQVNSQQLFHIGSGTFRYAW